MKTIAIFVKNLTSGGAEKQSVLLALTLAKDYQVHYIIFNAAKVHQKYLTMLKTDISIHVAAFKGGRWRRFRYFVEYLKANHINVIFSFLTAANAYACLAALVYRMHVYIGLRNARLPIGKHLADMIMTNWMGHSAIINCYSGKEHFSKYGFYASKISVIPNCFEDIRPYQEKPMHGCKHVITVGRFVVQKDYETSIRAFAEVKRAGFDVHFDIVGYGELELNVRKWLKDYGVEDSTTIYLNPPNIPELLERADIYLSTSLFEGTSNSIMEGMNADLPIVCTDVGDNRRLVEDGVNGFVCSMKDYVALAVSMEKLFTNDSLRKHMGQASKKHLQAGYSMQRFRQDYVTLIDSSAR